MMCATCFSARMCERKEEWQGEKDDGVATECAKKV